MTELIVKTKYGQVEGFVKSGVSRWYGVPFAKPPVGDLRFRRPLECESWNEVKDCTKFGGRPYQFKLSSLTSKKNDTEDCLYLNIWRRNSDEKNLPIIVWIHGGYLHCGCSYDLPYDGESFAKEGVMFISIGYRLGPLGCYDFSMYNKDLFDSNCSLADQIMALRWIKENIAAFGGDPNNVTIDGESAGALSVLSLLACPSAKGLFQKAISQSGYPDGILTTKKSKKYSDMFLEYLHIKPEEVEKLKTIDKKSLQSANDYVFKTASKCPGMYWPSFVYDDLLPENCFNTIGNGSAEDVKLIIGTCKNEATLIKLLGDCPKNKDEVKKIFENNNMLEEFKSIEDFYYIQEKGGDSAPSLNFSKDYLFLLGSLDYADILSQKQDVWMYRFDFMPPLLKLFGLKATHSVDLQAVFDKQGDIASILFWLFTRPSSKKILYDSVHYSWVNFAKTGDPNGDHLKTKWEKYDPIKRKTLLFDRTPLIVENPEKEIINLWKNAIKTRSFYN